MRQQRPRHPVSRVKLAVARPFFRYSYSRDAYVLRGVGNHRGPVLVPEAQQPVDDRDARFAKSAERDRVAP